MRLFIIGANGKTGTQLIDLGLARGHEITAFVRSPEKIVRRDDRLQIVRGDPHSVAELTRALPGHDVVFSALGIRMRQIFRPITLLQDCAAPTVAAMTSAGVRRLFVVSAATLFPMDDWRFRLFRWLLAHQIRDLEVTEEIIRATSLDWTIARPPRLTQARDEAYRSAVDGLPEDGWSMSFRAVAAFLLDAAEERAHIRETVGIAR